MEMEKERGKNKGRKGRYMAIERGRHWPGRGWREKDGGEKWGMDTKEGRGGGFFSCFLKQLKVIGSLCEAELSSPNKRSFCQL